MSLTQSVVNSLQSIFSSKFCVSKEFFLPGSSASMVNAIEVRKVTQDVLLFVWFKHGALSEEPPRESGLIPKISDELMNNLSTSVLIESFRNQFIWNDFFKKHFERMTSSPEQFATYAAYACYVLNESSNAFECFFDILSIVAEFSLRCLEGDRKEYLNTCVDLFCTFFKMELQENFENQGGWENFNDYIEKQYNSIQSKSMISDNKSSIDLFKYFPEALERGNRPDYVNSMGALKKRKQPYFVVNGIVLKDITQTQVETHEKAVGFAKSIQYKLGKLVQKTFDELIIDYQTTYIKVKNLSRWADELSNLLKSKDQQWNLVKNVQKKKHFEHVSTQEVQQYPNGMNNVGIQRKIDQESSVESQAEQCYSRKVQESFESKEVQRKMAQESSGQKKREGEQCSSLEVRELPGGTKSKGMQRKIDQVSSGRTKRQGEQYSSRKIRKPPNVIKIKGLQRKIDQGSSGEIKSKEMQQKTDQESSIGINNQVERYSLNVEEVSEIVTCLLRLRKKNSKAKQSLPSALKDSEFNLQDHVASVQSPNLKLK